MKILAIVCALALALGAQTAGSRSGQNVFGTVTNATTGKALAHASVTLVRLQNGMQDVDTTVTGARGQYRFSESAPGPYMVQTDFEGVTYSARATAGESETDLNVFAASHDAAPMHVDAEIMVLQPESGQLAIVNEYRVENLQQPPRTLVQKKGIFRFRVAKGAAVDMVRVIGPGALPLTRRAIATAEQGVYRVQAPLRPGETRIQISYQIPYSGLHAAITETPAVPTAHFEIYVPAPMTFSGPGFVQLGQQDGYDVYGIGGSQTLPASFHFEVSGNAPLPSAAAQAAGVKSGSASGATGSNAGAGSGMAGGPEAASAPVAAGAGAPPQPTFFERNRWTLLALLAIVVAAGFGILLAKPREVETATAGAPGGESARLALPAASPSTASGPAASAQPASAAASAPAELARLKDDLFLLEVQRHTGRLEEDEYQRQRAALDARMTAIAENMTAASGASFRSSPGRGEG